MSNDVHAMPKAELHVHLEGGLRSETRDRLAARHGLEVSDAPADYSDLGQFLADYDLICQSMRTSEDFRDATLDVVEQCAASNVRHLEMFFSPQSHPSLPYAAMLDGIMDAFDFAADRHGMTALLIPAHNRELGAEAGLAFIEMVLADRRPRVAGIGMDYDEADHPPGLFTAIYDRAKEAGLGLTIHAGEDGPAENVRYAVERLGCRRIDHGYRVIDDPTLIERCRELDVLFTVCPSTTLLMTPWNDLNDPKHAIRQMLDAGLKLTVGTDDPGMFGTDLNREYMLLLEGGVSQETLEICAANGLAYNWN